MPTTDNEAVTAKNYLTMPPGEHACGDNLFLIVAPNGRGRWLFRYQRNWIASGKKQRMGLGSTRSVDFLTARGLAIDYLRLLAQNMEPKAHRHEKRLQFAMSNGPLFGAYATQWRETYAQAALTHKSSQAKLKLIVETYCKPLHKLRVADVTTQHIVAHVLKPIWQQVEATRDTRQILSRIFNTAVAENLRAENPARWAILKPTLAAKFGRIPKRGKVRGSYKALAHADVPAFMATLAAEDNRSTRALEVLALTVARTSEIRNMKWSQIDFDAGVWTIKPEDVPDDSEGGEGTKNERIKITPLSRQALAILRELHASRISDYVFPGRELAGPMSNMTMLKMFKDLSGDREGTVHGLRGTFRTWAQDELVGSDHETIEHCMHHIVGDAAEKAYKHGQALKKRRAVLQAWADFAKPQGKSNVIALPTRAA